MCTVIVVNHHHKEFPLVVAANRDEDYGRPSSPVQILSREPLVIGGKDEAKGGTWFGVNKHSIFVTGTNQGLTDKTIKTSRGLLITEALKCKTLDELLTFIEELNPAKYNKFNIVFGNSKAVFIAHSYLLHSMVIRELPPGVHVISSDMKFTGEDPKVQYIHKRLDVATDIPWLKYYSLLKKTLASSEFGVRLKPHQRESNGKPYGHCTRSSTIVAFSESGLERYKFYDRTAPRSKKKSKEDVVPSRYKDYIELWRNPDTFVPELNSNEVKYETVDDPPELNPKDLILKKLKKKVDTKHKMWRAHVVKPVGCMCKLEERGWGNRIVIDKNCPVHSGLGGGLLCTSGPAPDDYDD